MDRAEEDQLGHRRRGTSEEGTDQEGSDGEDVDRPSAIDVGDLPVERGDGSRCQEIGSDDPGVMLKTIELFDDRFERSRDDGLIEGC